ncbi:SpoIIE family protein phosphatase [Catalinimonas niigatensis]|uniref:SpoIIE family protein phosphatase n=1 Tax=Catalinimonas niigatensis TaxID=1397264 RepID=UPI002664E704|nr:SpoIIE family protein phosphatase [Catalinimonas niigatensis]WPP48617.1 SpoIIE family protein phosphatase [Catalinimonas niigatensis]
MAKKDSKHISKAYSNVKFIYRLRTVVGLFFVVIKVSYAQSIDVKDNTQTFNISQVFSPFKEDSGGKHLGFSESKSQEEEPGQDYLVQARNAYLAGSYAEALPYALQALSKFEASNNTLDKGSAYQLLSSIYEKERVYAQALFYDQQLERLMITDPTKADQLAALRFNMSQRYIDAEDFDRALLYAQKAWQHYDLIQAISRLQEVYETLLFIAQQQERYDEALQYAQWLQHEYLRQKNYPHQVSALNNLGFIYQRLGEKRKAIESFKQAISQSNHINEEHSTVLLTNLGLAYSNLGNDKQALQYYHQALEKQIADNNRAGQAEAYNYIASHYYLSGRQSNALKTALEASQIALEEREWEILLDSYRLLRLIYQREKRDTKAKEYEDKFLETQAYVDSQAQKRKDELDRIYQLAIAKEEEIKAFWNEKEQNALTQERKETRLKLQEQELSLLKQEKELQSLALSKQILEGNNARQALAIANQRLQAEQQERQLEALSREKEIQTLRIQRQKLEQEKQKQTIDLLETDRQLKEQRLVQEAKLRKSGYGILGLCVFIIAVTAYSFVQKSKDNKRLKGQKKEILIKNELLHRNEEDLKSHMLHLEKTREQLAQQKEQLVLVHNRLQESITYAKQIQESILPNDQYLKQLFPESCLIFMPKDTVSGDFYWVSQHQGYQILIVADCTGHGVPGALITLIGHSLLTEAIQARQMRDPSTILTFLHQKLLERFRYHESSRQHGMDIGVCVIWQEGGRYNVQYSGAKNTLLMIKNGELGKIKGNRISIGGTRQDVSFDCQTLHLNPGDKIYLSSDGFIDQPNMDRRRFGSAQLASCLIAWHRLPMEDQKKHLLSAFADHQQGTEQRDDVSLIGVSF